MRRRPLVLFICVVASSRDECSAYRDKSQRLKLRSVQAIRDSILSHDTTSHLQSKSRDLSYSYTNDQKDKQVEIEAHAFDWDDNIIHMPTKIYMVHNGIDVAVSTQEFVTLQSNKSYALRDNDFNVAMREFKDFEDPDIFPRHAKKAAADRKFAPAFDAWKAQLLEAAPWAIITARSHSAHNLRRGAKEVIMEVLSDTSRSEMINLIRKKYSGLMKQVQDFENKDEEVLDFYLEHICNFYGITGAEFKRRMASWIPSRKLDVTLDVNKDGKKVAFHHFTEGILALAGSNPAQVDFSDDHPRNVKNIRDFINSAMTTRFPEMGFIVFSTANGVLEKIETFRRTSTLPQHASCRCNTLYLSVCIAIWSMLS